MRPLKDIVKTNQASMRASIVCPCCGSKCMVSSSRQETDKLRKSHVQCLNAACGWSGVAATEIIRTISPPSPLYGGKEPAHLSAEEIRRERGDVQHDLL